MSESPGDEDLYSPEGLKDYALLKVRGWVCGAGGQAGGQLQQQHWALGSAV